MTPDEAAWVRDNVWPAAMRKEFGEVPGFYTTCACQYGMTTWCQQGNCDRCHRAAPLRDAATAICGRGGMRPLYFAEPYEHPTDTSAIGPRRMSIAQVWLADRVCRWVCPHECHAMPRPEQGELFALEVA